MNTVKTILLFIGIVFFNSIFAQDKEFAKAGEFYQNGEYSKAIEIYDSLYMVDIVSYELLYNIGNSYFNKSDYSHAILFWERAKLINPKDPDLLHNLEIVNGRIADQIEPLPDFFISKIWNSTIYFFNDKEWTYINLAFWFLLMISLWFFFTSEKIKMKKICFYLSIILLIFSLLSGYAGYGNYRQNTAKKTAIIITPTVNIKSSPDSKSNTIFVLHSGTKVKILEKIGDWYQISIRNGNQGWIDKNEFEKI